MFLKKVYEPRPTEESIQTSSTVPSTEENVENCSSSNKKFCTITRRSTKDKEIDDKMAKYLDSRMTQAKENPNLLFFKGMLPAVDLFTMDETLEFQAGVLALIQKIKGRNRVGYQTYDVPNTGWQDQYCGYYTQYPVNQQPTAFIPSPSLTSQTSYQANQQSTNFIQSPSPTTQSSYYSQRIPPSPTTSTVQSPNSQDLDILKDFSHLLMY
ncbi:unnamed protein product [Diabrotica balteata]|uniref:BESS domain-containing protein n=1 Tax=Diabrotica balteata TaxID=107213 RepID=A0A9N9T837_DIABA|nr:unnamed protein product [Diabrotica balteata]